MLIEKINEGEEKLDSLSELGDFRQDKVDLYEELY